MELYVLDELLRRETVIDTFDSVVWTERYNDLGDLTLNIHSTLANRNLLKAGTVLAMNKSKRMMIVKTVQDKKNQDGTQVLVITGSSYEIVLDDRPARDTMAGTTSEPQWVIDGLPADIARQIFKNVCIDGLLDVADILPFYTVGNSYPVDNLPEPVDSVEAALDLQTVLSALKTMCQTYDLGFRITRNADASQIFFNIYSGNDRTSSQMILPAIVFAPVLDNLLDSSYLVSELQYKNMAYVFCPDGSAKVYDPSVDPGLVGLIRKVLLVNATDVKYEDRTIAGVGETPAYIVTDPQIAAVKIASSITNTTQLQQDSLNKIPGMKRLLPQDLVNIATAIAPVFAFTGTQAASILAAQTVVGITTDQVTALVNLGAMSRLTSSDVSALNTLISNNTALTVTEKADIPAAANLQNATMMPSENILINAAIVTSEAYNPTEDAALAVALQARGIQELAKCNNITAFDGEIPQTGSYKYDFDYYLGDILEVRNQDGVVNNVRVTEQIMSQDSSGEKSYPTLSSREVITPGVWDSWDASEHWAEVPDPQHWDDLP